MNKYKVFDIILAMSCLAYFVVLFVSMLGFNMVTANNISILHLTFGVSDKNLDLWVALYLFEQFLWLLPLTFYKSKVFSVVGTVVYLIDIACAFYCFYYDVFKEFQLLFECSGVIWHMPLLFDVIFVFLFVFRINVFPAYIPVQPKRRCLDFCSAATTRVKDKHKDFRRDKNIV